MKRTDIIETKTMDSADSAPVTIPAMPAEASSTSQIAQAAVPTLRLLNGPMTLQSALNTDENIIHEANYVAATEELYTTLWKEKETIEALTKHHLDLGVRDSCCVGFPKFWIRGAFNVCIPVKVKSSGTDDRKVFFRCAMPHKLAEAENPGTMDEKVACEVASYVWMQEKCPDIRIPLLYGFGFSDGRYVSALRQLHLQLSHSARGLVYLFLILTLQTSLRTSHAVHSMFRSFTTFGVCSTNYLATLLSCRNTRGIRLSLPCL